MKKQSSGILPSNEVNVLHPFEVATTFLSYEENAPISAILQVLCGLKESLCSDRGSDQLLLSLLT